MVLASILPSPQLLRTTSFKKPYTKYELGSWSQIFERHRFLLAALALLTLLCTIYLYFAITFTVDESCSGLSGPEYASCHMEHVKASITKTKPTSLTHHLWFQYKLWWIFFLITVQVVVDFFFLFFLSFPLGDMKSKCKFWLCCIMYPYCLS